MLITLETHGIKFDQIANYVQPLAWVTDEALLSISLGGRDQLANSRRMVYLEQILYTYSCKLCQTTGMQNSDEAVWRNLNVFYCRKLQKSMFT